MRTTHNDATHSRSRAARAGVTVAALLSALTFSLCLAACGQTKPPDTGDHILSRDQFEERAFGLAARADSAAQQGKLDKAIDLYEQALSMHTGAYVIWSNYGELLMKKDDYMRALKAFTNAAQLDRSDPVSVYNKGLIFFNRRRFDEALDYFEQSLQRDDDYLPALRGAIVCAVEMNDPSEEALGWIRSAELIDRDTEWRGYYQTHRRNFERTLAED